MEDFSISGPHHLTMVDWTSKNHCRSIAASLVNGVYMLEKNRKLRERGQETLVSKWWEHFQFKLIETHKDVRGDSIFAATFEYKGNDSTPNHPRYVLAFRGTLINREDFKLDARVFGHRTLAKDPRYEKALNVLENPPLRDINRTQIWMVGHSLGAILALGVGKTMANKGCYIESYLFNPPFPLGLVEQFKKGKLKEPIHVCHKLLITTVATVVKGIPSLRENTDSFLGLSKWTPHLFVHPEDRICLGYIEYFESRKFMKAIGLDCLNKVASSSSIVNLAAEAVGRGGEATHLIPSAYVIKNMGSSNADLFEAHRIRQWWQQQLHCESKRHLLDNERSYHETQTYLLEN